MDETLTTIIGIMVAIVIMLIVPMILLADRSDDVSQLVAKTATAEFVDDVIKTGQITNVRYQKFIDSLYSSGNTYEIDMEVKILDENTSKKVTDADPYQIGNNTYYSIFTSQVEEKLAQNNGKFRLKQGDSISVTVRNNSKTLSQVLKSFYYDIKGEDIHIISATSSGTVAINGTT